MRTRTSIWLAGAACAALAAACAPRIELRDDEPDARPDQPSGPVVNDDAGDGVTITTVKATSETAWVYVSLESKEAVEPAEPADSEAWDLGFRRYHIKMNGGASGAGGMEAAVLFDAVFEELDQAPASGYLADAPDDAEEPDEEPDYLLSKGEETRWFNYNPATHVVTPRETVYVLRSVAGAYYKLQMLGYYNDAGSPAYMRFRWAEVAPPQEDLPHDAVPPEEDL